MALEQHIRAVCSAELVSRVLTRTPLSASDQAALFDYMRHNINADTASCCIAATHHVGEAMKRASDDTLIGAFLAAYADHSESLTNADRDLIAAKVETFSDMRGDRAALVLEYLILLRIDMREQFAPLIDLQSSWAGRASRHNVSFLGLLHRGLFGSEYIEQIVAGLKTITDADELVNHLLVVSDVAPPDQKRIFEAFVTDPRMTAPHFTIPERVGGIARSLAGL